MIPLETSHTASLQPREIVSPAISRWGLLVTPPLTNLMLWSGEGGHFMKVKT